MSPDKTAIITIEMTPSTASPATIFKRVNSMSAILAGRLWRLVILSSPPANGEGIYREIERDDGDPDHDLVASFQTRRIDDGRNILFDESAVIGWFARHCSEPIFEWRQWTDPASEFDQCPPRNRWQVRPGQPRPSENRQTSQRDKSDEDEVEDENEIGQN